MTYDLEIAIEEITLLCEIEYERLNKLPRKTRYRPRGTKPGDIRNDILEQFIELLEDLYFEEFEDELPGYNRIDNFSSVWMPRLWDICEGGWDQMHPKYLTPGICCWVLTMKEKGRSWYWIVNEIYEWEAEHHWNLNVTKRKENVKNMANERPAHRTSTDRRLPRYSRGVSRGRGRGRGTR
jgi:hypothetical protein